MQNVKWTRFSTRPFLVICDYFSPKIVSLARWLSLTRVCICSYADGLLNWSFQMVYYTIFRIIFQFVELVRSPSRSLSLSLPNECEWVSVSFGVYVSNVCHKLTTALFTLTVNLAPDLKVLCFNNLYFYALHFTPGWWSISLTNHHHAQTLTVPSLSLPLACWMRSRKSIIYKRKKKSSKRKKKTQSYKPNTHTQHILIIANSNWINIDS